MTAKKLLVKVWIGCLLTQALFPSGYGINGIDQNKTRPLTLHGGSDVALRRSERKCEHELAEFALRISNYIPVGK